jgi:hypothetical protein
MPPQQTAIAAQAELAEAQPTATPLPHKAVQPTPAPAEQPQATLARGAPSATPIAVPMNPIFPLLDNVAAQDDGTFIAYFGYENKNEFALQVPIGPENYFSPDPINRNQPTTFQPGRSLDRRNGTFAVQFKGGVLQWTLTGHTTTAAVFD